MVFLDNAVAFGERPVIQDQLPDHVAVRRLGRDNAAQPHFPVGQVFTGTGEPVVHPASAGQHVGVVRSVELLEHLANLRPGVLVALRPAVDLHGLVPVITKDQPVDRNQHIDLRHRLRQPDYGLELLGPVQHIGPRLEFLGGEPRRERLSNQTYRHVGVRHEHKLAGVQVHGVVAFRPCAVDQPVQDGFIGKRLAGTKRLFYRRLVELQCLHCVFS